MADHLLVFEGYEFSRDVNGAESGTKTFVEKAGGTRSLPTFGGSFGPIEGTTDMTQPSSSCKLHTIKCRVLGNGTKKYICEYKDQSSGGLSKRIAPDTSPESFRASIQTAQVMGGDNDSSHTWGAEAGGDPVVGMDTHSVEVVVIDYTKTQNYSSLSAAMTASPIAKVNKVSASNAKWMYIGADIDQMVDEEGNDVFRVTRAYRWRSQEWNKFYRADGDHAGWDYIYPAIFETASGAFPDEPFEW